MLLDVKIVALSWNRLMLIRYITFITKKKSTTAMLGACLYFIGRPQVGGRYAKNEAKKILLDKVTRSDRPILIFLIIRFPNAQFLLNRSVLFPFHQRKKKSSNCTYTTLKCVISTGFPAQLLKFLILFITQAAMVKRNYGPDLKAAKISRNLQ